MALAETLNFTDIFNGSNPYEVRPDSPEIINLTRRLITDHEPFMDSTRFDDMSADGHDYRVYLLAGNDPFANIARSLEGAVMSSDWGKSPEITKNASSLVEENSSFFIVVDAINPDSPQPAASLSIADGLQGPFETAQIFKEKFPSIDLPEELTITTADKFAGHWDVMAIMALKDWRGTHASYWAYSALYAASQLFGVHRWTASMTDREFSTLKGIGIPFKVIDEQFRYSEPRPGKDPVWFGFHTINVDEIRVSMVAAIAELEKAAESDTSIDWQAIANVARIALDGATK